MASRSRLWIILPAAFCVLLLMLHGLWSDHTRTVKLKVAQIHQNVIKMFQQGGSAYDKPINDTRFIAAKWIVTTTIAPPTEDIIALSKVPGWQLLVVGDMKTPKDWSCMGAIFLSVEDQMSLQYSILDVIPYGSYSRKNIGYLYAIQHGAQVIYETDDDNHPVDGLKSFLFGKNMTIMEAPTDTGLFNPYAHFGQETIWPRGYPVERISETNKYTYRLCKTKRPAVQQGLVNGDPDVDAIFRLTRKNDRARINVTFDSAAPPISLAPRTFCPYNSQNTLFHYEAFWSLVLPMTVTMRVTDIWRSYWAQGLLPLIGERLVFLPPNALQFRNAHSYLKDFKDEMDLYLKAGNLVKLLTDWKCARNSLVECGSELAYAMAGQGMWNAAEAEMIDMWFNDLKRVGYKFPDLNMHNPCDGSARRLSYKPKQRPSVFQNSKSLMKLSRL